MLLPSWTDWVFQARRRSSFQRNRENALCFPGTIGYETLDSTVSRKAKRPLPPRTSRMNRARRLQSARHWLATQTGRTPVQIAKSYRKRYGVDWPCAIHELSQLGVQLDSAWVAQLNRSLLGAHRARRETADTQAMADCEQADSNDEFAYIAGYTPNGFPFGVTWDEWRQSTSEIRQTDSENECPF